MFSGVAAAASAGCMAGGVGRSDGHGRPTHHTCAHAKPALAHEHVHAARADDHACAHVPTHVSDLHTIHPLQATRAYLHAEDDVEAALSRAGFKVVRKEMTATKFYFSRLFEAVRV